MLVLDLFSGIGGFSLGLERAGFQTVAFCERAPFARSILQRHWPSVPCYGDVGTLCVGRLQDDGIAAPDLICGGFPCQDISTAGKGAGLDGERSGLWCHMLRIVAECRPAWVVAENVLALRIRGADRIIGGLEQAGSACCRSWWVLSTPAHPTAGNAYSSWHGPNQSHVWPTPRARDWKSASPYQRNRRRACPLNDAVGGSLNPDWVEWLMGFPPGWTAAPG